MAGKSSIWSKNGKFGLSHDGEEPTEYSFDTQKEAEAERDRLFVRNSAVEESTSGVGKQAEGELHADVYSKILHG